MEFKYGDKRPEWFNYISVRKRTIIGSNRPPDFLISFGPRNICLPENDERKAERLAESIKEWLWHWMTQPAPTGEKK